jgi:hypothetical protein
MDRLKAFGKFRVVDLTFRTSVARSDKFAERKPIRVDTHLQIRLFTKLKLMNRARAGDRAGLFFSSPAVDRMRPKSLLQSCDHCMAPARSLRALIVPGLYFQWRSAWRNASLHGCARLNQSPHRKPPPVLLPVVYRKNRVDCTPSLRHEN